MNDCCKEQERRIKEDIAAAMHNIEKLDHHETDDLYFGYDAHLISMKREDYDKFVSLLTPLPSSTEEV